MSEVRIANLTMRDYLAHMEFSASDIKNYINHGPYVFKKLRDNNILKEETKALTFGTAVHYALLETKDFAKNYVIDSGWNKNTKKYKEWKAELPEEKIIVTEKFLEQVEDIKRSLKDARLLSLIEKGNSEITFLEASSPEHPYGRRCRADKIIKEHKLIVDLKTTASLKWFSKDIFRYGYQYSVPHYTEIISKFYGEKFEYVFLAVESSYPYPCQWYKLGETSLNIATEEYRDAVSEIKKCIDMDDWPNLTSDYPIMV